MERKELEIQRLINFCADQINNGNLNGDMVPDLDDCQNELRCLIETYSAVVIREDKRF